MDIVNFEKLPLTASQLDILLDQQRFPDSRLYTIGGYFQLTGEIDAARLKRAINEVIESESTFSIRFDLNGETPYQYLSKAPLDDIHVINFTPEGSGENSRNNAHNNANEWARSDFEKTFILTEKLYRVALLTLSDNSCWLYLKAHHLIMDGWSYSLFIERVLNNYNTICSSSNSIEKKRGSFWEYITAQSSTITDNKKHQIYWQSRLVDLPPLMSPSKHTSAYTKAVSIRHQFTFSTPQIAPLLHLAQEQKSSGFHALLALVYSYFVRAYAIDEVLIGTPIHGRSGVAAKNIIGMLAGTSPTRLSFGTDSSFAQIISAIRQQLTRDFRHQNYAIGNIYRDLQLAKQGRDRLFDVFVSYENFAYKKLSTSELNVHPVTLTHGQDQVPFSLFIRQYDADGTFEFDLQLRTDFFSDDDAILIEQRFRHLLKTAIAQPDLALHQLHWLPENEILALQTLNNVSPALEPTVHILKQFSQAVATHPHKTAVIGTNNTLSFSALDQASTELAHWLIRKGITSEQLVAVCMDRTTDLLVVLIAIWKAGAAYLPLDPSYPEERLHLILQHSAACLVITQKNYRDFFEQNKISCIDMSGTKLSVYNYPLSEQLGSINTADTDFPHNQSSLAYVIYTSGSTGIPKGVAIEHGSLANFLSAMSLTPGITEKDILLAVTTISFDIHILELFLPLVSGATIVLAGNEQTRDAFALCQLMQQHQVSIMQATPATWKMLFHADWQPQIPFKALCGGEALPPALMEKFQCIPLIELWNMYGPTEATVWASVACLKHIDAADIHLGNPLPNVRYFVLDRFGYPTGFNLPGELHISGNCLAREYVNDAEKTNASFIWHQLPGQPVQRFYKTGDQVSLRSDHTLGFRERNDDQVKVRGYRIELGDIEAALSRHPKIKDAAVKIWRDHRQENYLAAYCVIDSISLTETDLVNFLEKSLPDYMIPSAISWLDALPLTPNGKINRKALPEPERSLIDLALDAPLNPLEKQLAEVWSILLQVSHVGKSDDFFRLGGDSIINIQMVNRLRKSGTAIEVADIFQSSRLTDLAQKIASRNTIAVTNHQVLSGNNTAHHLHGFPLSTAQQRLYIVQQLEGAETAYNMYGAFLLSGPLHIARLEQAFVNILTRHPILRSRFSERDGDLYQEPIPISAFPIMQKPLPPNTNTGSINQWLQQALATFVRPFDLSLAPLLRAELWTRDNKAILFIDMHHIAVDGLSINIFLQELFASYDQQILPILNAHYADFINWQQHWLKSPAFATAANYWYTQFSNDIPSLDFPCDYARPALQTFTGKRLRFSLSPTLTQSLKALAKTEKTTLFMLLLAAYNLLLAKYTGREDIVIGTPVSRRPDERFHNMIGMFVNTLPLRNFPVASKTWNTFLQEIKQVCSDAFQHQDYPFEKLIEQLALTRDASRNPLFDCVLVLQAEEIAKIDCKELGVDILPIDYHQAKFDLTLDAIDCGEKLEFTFEYATQLFNETTIQRLGQRFITLLDNIVAQPNVTLGELSIINSDEYEILLSRFNNTQRGYPDNQTLSSIFETQVEKTPAQVAVKFAEKSFSYAELNAKANQLARVLRARGVARNQVVAIMLERSLELPLTIIAILKAGGAYLPIAPNLPRERINYMLADSGATLLLTATAYAHIVTSDGVVDDVAATYAGDYICIDDEALYAGSELNLPTCSGPQDLAYIIYTSGSTGQPKGVMIEHSAVVNRIYWMQANYPLAASDVILQKTPYTFDVSVWELFWWSFAGASVYFLTPDGEKDPQRIFSCIAQEHISVLHFVPSMLTASLEFLTAHLQNGNSLPWDLTSLRYVFASGEALNPSQVDIFNSLVHRHSGAQLINLYGPTEAAIDVTYFNCPVAGAINRVPIGKPIDNIRLYILDNEQRLAPQGIPGELYIAGVGVGRGYVNKPDLTQEKFQADPFNPGARMYRTGDLCRWLDDGNIEYLGRLDHQVKIRGYRIELGEIETRLLSHPQVREAVVVAQKDTLGQTYLCAYLVSRSTIDIAELRQHLAHSLPDYMVPSHILVLAKMPLNASGKIDRKQLPAPDYNTLDVEVIAPQGELENQLLHIMQKLLGSENLGVTDNFFQYGGDSIRAIQFSARAAQAGLHLGIKEIFKYPSVRQLAFQLEHSKRQEKTGLAQCGTFGLTAIQHAFFERDLHSPQRYCQYVILQAKHLKRELLQQSFNLLLQQHDLLRASVITASTGHYQLHIPVLENSNWELHVVDIDKLQHLTDKSIDTALLQLRNELQEKIQLDGPLYSAGILSTPAQDYIVLVIHHLIIDGVSWRILLDDLASSYGVLDDNRRPARPLKTNNLGHWAEASADCAQSYYLERQLGYWQQVQQAIIPALMQAHPEQSSGGIIADQRNIQRFFSATQIQPLLIDVHRAYGTDVQDLLITALVLAWQQWTGKITVALDLESHGRELPGQDLSVARSLGWFTALYPWTISVAPATPLDEVIPLVKEQLRRVPNKGVGYGLLKYCGSDAQRKILAGRSPDILFNYLGHIDLEPSAAWQLLHTGLDSAPENTRSHKFEINVMICNGQLELHISYPGAAYSSESVTALERLFNAQLEQVIAHCLAQHTSTITPSDLGDANLSLDGLRKLQTHYTQYGKILAIAPLTPTQQGILFHTKTLSDQDKRQDLYYEELSFYISRSLDVNLLQKALDHLVRKHSILRTLFVTEGFLEPRQIVLDDLAIQLTTVDIGHLTTEEQEMFLQQQKCAGRARGFDWQEPLLRLQLFKTQVNEALLLLSFHHIIFDGWSCASFIEQLLSTYTDLMSNKNPTGHAKPFVDYLHWQAQQDVGSAREYWRSYLAGFENKIQLPGEISHSRSDYQAHEMECHLDNHYLTGLQKLAGHYQVTLNTLLQAAWGLLLQRYNNTDDVLFVSVVSGRPAAIEGIEQMLGLFINSIPVRITAPGNTISSYWLQSLQTAMLSSEQHAFLGLADIAQASTVQTDLFRHLWVFENYPIDQTRLANDHSSAAANLSIDRVSLYEQTHYDFNLLVQPGEQLHFRFNVNALVHPPATLHLIAQHLLQLLRHWVETGAISNTDIIPGSDEKAELLALGSGKYYCPPQQPDNLSLRFSAQAQRSALCPAVFDGQQQFSYTELQHKAARVAQHLLAQGITPEVPVALLAKRSAGMIAALVGTVQTGAVLVPIDPSLPHERIIYMLKDCGATLLLVDTIETELQQQMPGVVQLDINLLLENDCLHSHPLPAFNSDNLLYIIYTSGTTGQPKGVMLEHRNLLTLLDSQNAERVLDFSGKVLQFATHSFDVCYQEIFSTLLAGGCLYVIDEQLKKDANYLLGFIGQHHIDTLFFPTAYLKFLFSLPECVAQMPDSVRHIITAGEQLLVAPALRHYLQQNSVYLHNHYGPSETHVVTSHLLHAGVQIDDIPVIGKPINGNRIYLLDKQGRIQPRGALGEICIAGTSVGRGYWNNTELSAQKFECESAYSNLFDQVDRLYRTGDLGFWNHQGELVYLGRSDQQVKVRGYRIEPGEIESCLNKYPGVREAAVIVKRDAQGENYLLAYVVMDHIAVDHRLTDDDLIITQLKTHATNELPPYMVPAFFIPLVQLPLTTNGKLDRRALPSVDQWETAAADKQPTRFIQRRLAEHWCRILGIQSPGLNTDFFAVGGHSLNATLLAAAINRDLGVTLTLKQIFTLRQLGQQADYIEQLQKEQQHTEHTGETDTDRAKKILLIPHHAENNHYPLSPAQQRLYIFDQLAGLNTTYNIPFTAKLASKLDIDRLVDSLQQLIERHKVLRTSITIDKGQPLQIIRESRFTPEFLRVKQENVDLIIEQFVQPFDLHREPLVRIKLLQLQETNEHWLLWDMHHIIADGISLEILLRELMTLYLGDNLPTPDYHYSDFSLWQAQWQFSEHYAQQRDYWLSQYRELPPALELPCDYPRPSERIFTGAEIYLDLDTELGLMLHEFANTMGVSIFLASFSAYALWLSRYTGETDIAIGTPVSGRSITEFAQTPGLFVNTLALRINIDGQLNTQQLVQTLAAQLLEDLQHQDYPFDALINDLQLARNPGRNPLFDTMFSLGRDLLAGSGAEQLFQPQPITVKDAKFDLAFSLNEQAGKYQLAINYANALFKPETVERMGQHYLNLLRQMLEHPTLPVDKLNLLSVAEYQQLTLEFNNTLSDYPSTKSIPELFETIAAQHGGSLAVRDDVTQISYGELNARANQLAAYLRKRGLLSQAIVGVMLPRTNEWIIAMLAVLKAGAVYMPIAPGLPPERIRAILQDAGAVLLLSTESLMAEEGIHLLAHGDSWRTLLLEQIAHQCSELSTENPPVAAAQAQDLAYVIYTSGSTGTPKGVLIEQRAVVNLATWARREYELQNNTRFLQMTSIGFDVSIEETLVPLLNGASVFIMDDEEKMDKRRFRDFIQQHQIEIAEIVPSLLSDYIANSERLDSLNIIITGAERLDPQLKDQVLARGYRLHNVYGPTETTVNATSKCCQYGVDTIGKPMANSLVYVLDPQGRIQPIGVPGELCVSGVSLARGYRGNPELTAEKFVPNPLLAGARLYKTGDLVKWTSDGEIQFIGRIDHQVKIRGYRIELGDIESRMSAINGIGQAVVILRDENRKEAYLCAYYTGIKALDVAFLRAQLATWLPAYMLPSHYIFLDQIPLTPNGKVDKKAMPIPAQNTGLRSDYRAPVTATEQQLAQLWGTLLGGTNYSKTESFFDAGGHSLLAIKLLTAINQEWQISLTLAALFNHPVLESQAELISQTLVKTNETSLTDSALPDYCSLLNNSGRNPVFLFPPALGENIIYANLARELNEYSFYAFRYLDDPARLHHYADAITQIQPTGDIYLFGYSAGGNLAFEVGKVLESRGRQLGGLVLLDSVRRRTNTRTVTREKIRADIEVAFAQNQFNLDESFITGLVENAYHYGVYIEQLINGSWLQGPIHLIKAEIESDPEIDYGWSELTSNLSLHEGTGEHLQMLAAGNNLKHNCQVIRQCFNREKYRQPMDIDDHSISPTNEQLAT